MTEQEEISSIMQEHGCSMGAASYILLQQRNEALRSRLAEVEAALKRCADYLDASATCNSDRAMASMARAVLAGDSAPAVHDCGKPLKLGQYGECVWCGYMPDKNYPSDQPNERVK